jgi:DNA-binding SARP family transcriptional activator
MPLHKRLHELNKWIGEDVIRFEPYTLDIGENGQYADAAAVNARARAGLATSHA